MAKRNLKVEAAIKRLKAFYQLGRQAAKETLGEGRNRQLAAFAADHGVSAAHIHNSIRFATLYDADEIKKLYAEMRATNTALGIGHIRELIQFSDESQANRRQLQAEALRQGWSVRQLQAIRLARYPQSRKQDQKAARQRGRLPRRPETVQEAYRMLAQRAEQLIRLEEVIRSTPEGKRSLTLKPDIRAQLTNVINGLNSLNRLIWPSKGARISRDRHTTGTTIRGSKRETTKASQKTQ